METENQIKSKKRVQDHGEVYTNPREVNAMLDLVKHETERIESRFLEPACGNGNFLIEILNRKLAVVTKRYAPNKHRSNDQWERYALLALSSMYGVEILLDNGNAFLTALWRSISGCVRKPIRMWSAAPAICWIVTLSAAMP
jgi:hypothetical protein